MIGWLVGWLVLDSQCKGKIKSHLSFNIITDTFTPISLNAFFHMGDLPFNYLNNQKYISL